MSSTPTTVSAEATPVPVNPTPAADQATPVPQSEWDLIHTQLRETPRNPDGWNRLITLAEESGDLEKIEASYEGLLQTYPNTVSSSLVRSTHMGIR
jgi:cleavage stimulation factor subunit 3